MATSVVSVLIDTVPLGTDDELSNEALALEAARKLIASIIEYEGDSGDAVTILGYLYVFPITAETNAELYAFDTFAPGGTSDSDEYNRRIKLIRTIVDYRRDQPSK